MLIKNATRLKNVHDWFFFFFFLKEEKEREQVGEGEEGKKKKPLAIYFLCVLLPERQSADQQFV